MLNQEFWGELELIEVKQCPRGGSNAKIVTIDSGKTKVFIPKVLVSELKWNNKERVNLYKMGKTFVLKPHKVGLLKVNTVASGAMMIYSKNLCLELLSRTKSCREYEAWVEEDALLFKPKVGEM